jgi:hypothetical protein
MLLVMDQKATPEEIAAVVAAIEARGYSARSIPGGERVAIGILNNKGPVDAAFFLGLPGVRDAIPVTRPYKLVSREFKPEDTVVQVGDVSGINGFQVFPSLRGTVLGNTGLIEGQRSGLEPGEKVFQFRCWQIEQDEGTDSNQSAAVMGIEIEVHRCLLFPDEEYFYCINEMLDNQQKLLNKTTWRDLVTLQSLVAGPIIDDVPILTSNVLSYTVSCSASVVPD